MNETIKLIKVLEDSNIDWSKLGKEWEDLCIEVYKGEINLDQIGKKISYIFEGVDKNIKSLIVAALFGNLIYRITFFFLGL